MSDETVTEIVTEIVTNDELREQIADVQHAIWAHWMRYMFSCGTYSETGNWIMPVDKVQRWRRQMDTPYADLTEREKDSDRDQADKVLAVLPAVTGNTSDGYHTFNELYEHRCLLFALLCNSFDSVALPVVDFKTRKNDKGEEWEGWFIAGMDTPFGQISYHLPNDLWELVDSPEIERNVNYDGHTSADVLERIGKMLKGGFNSQA